MNTCIWEVKLNHRFIIILLTYNRGDKFRIEFSRLGELRSLLPRHVNIMALTATATRQLRSNIIRLLGMKKTKIVCENPHRENIIYDVVSFDSMEGTFYKLILTLKRLRSSMPRTIIYCQQQDHCPQLYLLMKAMLGGESTEPPGSPDLPQFRLFDFHIWYSSIN